MATANSTISAEISDIQRRMAQVRHEMHQEVQGAVKGARSLTDWRSLVRSHPWLSLGVAAAAGYLIVPKRRWETPAVTAVDTPVRSRRRCLGISPPKPGARTGARWGRSSACWLPSRCGPRRTLSCSASSSGWNYTRCIPGGVDKAVSPKAVPLGRSGRGYRQGSATLVEKLRACARPGRPAMRKSTLFPHSVRTVS